MRKVIYAAADMLMLGILLLSAVLSIYTAVTVYPLNPYWIELLCDYSGGFVRRYLLGEILNNIPGVPPKIAGVTVLSASYLFVTLSLYAGIRRLNLPLFLRILVMFSPLGVVYYLLLPTKAEVFLLRDILIIALVILAAKTACFSREKPDTPGNMQLRDSAVCAIITFGMLCHSGILFCTPPLLVMYLGGSGAFRKGFIHAAVLGVIFIGEFLTVNLVFGELGPERILDILDMFKSKYPGIPMEISAESLLFSLFNVSQGGESYWVEMAQTHLFSVEKLLAFLAASMVPSLILLFRFVRSGLGISEYFRKNMLVTACSLCALSPVMMSAFATDFLRWLTWGSVLSVYFAMQGTEAAKKQSETKCGIRSAASGVLLTAAALIFVLFYNPSSPAGKSSGSGFLAKSNLDPFITVIKVRAPFFGSQRGYHYVILDDHWNWTWDIDTSAPVNSTEERVRIRDFSGSLNSSNNLTALESGCAAEFQYLNTVGRRLYVRGWEALAQGKDGEISLVRPAHGMGFLLKHGEDVVFYPTMPLAMIMKINRNDQKVPFAFDDYLLVRSDWASGKITIYPAFLNSKNKVFYCSRMGKNIVITDK